MGTLTFETVKTEVRDRVAKITLDRPERLNAISRQTMSDIRATLDCLEADSDIAVIVIHGAGRAFSAGMDLKDDAAGDTSGPDGWRRVLSENLEFVTLFWDFPKPTISAVHGYCMAAGCDMAMACDITIAEAGTFFGKPELKFGSVITAMVMPFLTGPKIAKELLLSADDRISAERAYEIGLVNHVVPQGEGLDRAMQMAARIAALDDDAVRITKLAINKSLDAMGLREALAANLDLSVEIETLETPSRRMFKEISQRDGLKAALAWRETRFDEGGDKN
ncbi:enoyl-CoA hydratase/isomerase family protein [Anderseniella sp. Alg231-50]|uniref:enoyl-CoA hydratase/isomerase family protein n=1 Tax=Anderseniella sp. Alg231-50 TaxID=1922226 RepID=UPI00307CA8D5